MRNLSLLLLFALLLPTLNCGSGATIAPPALLPAPSPAISSVSGNWDIQSQSVVSSGSMEFFGILQAGSRVTGMLHVFSPSCYKLTDIVPVSGAISAQGDTLSLTSDSVAGQVLTMTGVLSSDRNTFLSGTYAIDGGCGNGDHGTIIGVLVPAFTNTYTGTFKSFQTGKTTSVTLSLTQSPMPDAQGFVPVSGTATFVDSACFSSGTLSGVGSFVFGSTIDVVLDTNDGGHLSLVARLTDSSTKSIAGTYAVLSGSCEGDGGIAILEHP
jgi:hypothetical protein